MSAVRNSSSKKLAFLTAIGLVLSLSPIGALSGVANAQATAAYILDVQHEGLGANEVDSNPTGTEHTLTASVQTTTGTQTLGGVQVDFEIDCTTQCAGQTSGSYVILTNPNSGTTSAPDAGVDGDQTAGTTDDTRQTPEMSCITDSGGICSVAYTRTTNGNDLIAGFVDDNNNNTDNDSADSDATEPRDPATGNSVTEPDDTDVVEKQWFGGLSGNPTLDCDDADPGHDAANENTNREDFQANNPGETETYTCEFTTPDNADPDDLPQPVSGVRIDAEHEGPNDPDNRDFDVTPANTADYDNACTTDANGRCTFTLNPAENEQGFAEVCFWADEDNDNVFNPNGADENDGEQCDDENVYDGENDDKTDLVEKEWSGPRADSLDAAPEDDSNPAGTSHSVTATVLDQFGSPRAGVPVDFYIESGSRNDLTNTVDDDSGGDRLICDNQATSATGTATCTYTDVGTTLNPVSAPNDQDTIQVCADLNSTTNIDCEDGSEGADEQSWQRFNLTDAVEKFWYSGAVPATDNLVLDMDPGCCGFSFQQASPENNDCGDNDAGPEFNDVATTHMVCAQVFDVGGNVIPGKSVTFTLTGPGNFYADTDNDGEADTPGELRGTTITTTTTEEGIAYAFLYSEVPGSTTVTASSDGRQDTGIKVWESAEARTIDCIPETATNSVNTQHTVICTALDKRGEPVIAEDISFRETGPGNFVTTDDPDNNCDEFYEDDSDACVNVETDSSGEAEAIVTSSATGTQTIEGAIEDDATDGANGRNNTATGDANDDCDSFADRANENAPPNSEPGAPAGVCFDTLSKTWTAPTTPQCSDNVDNDADTLVDFPNDPGCSSGTDNDETNAPVVNTGRCSTFQEGSRNQRPGGGEVIVGTSGDDVLLGTGGADIICGLGGNDVISGRAGNDVATGDSGNDTVGGGDGKDSLRGGAGSDVMSGNDGNDGMTGGAGQDTMKGNSGIDTLRGQDAADTLQGGNGQDVLRGGNGNDTLRGGNGADALDGGPGSDQCFGNAGNDTLNHCE